MGYANYIGRVGALAVTLGVGVAIANAPAVAFADTSNSSSASSSSASESSSSSGSSTTNDTSASTAESAGAETSTSTVDADTDDATDASAAAEASDTEGIEDGDDAVEADAEADASSSDDEVAEDETSSAEIEAEDTESVDPTTRSSHESRSATRDFADEVKSYVNATVERFTRAQETEPPPDVTATANVSATEDVAPKTSSAPANPTVTFTTMTAPEAAPVSVTSQPRPTLVTVVTETVAAVLRPLMGLGADAPLQVPALWAMLAAARGEFEQGSAQQTAPPAAQYTVTQISSPSAQAADSTPYVLVIGVDGTNLGRILSDPENDHFFALMADGTTAASSIVGHTTISNPSWSAILTGVWGETTGVVNNVFTPGTYNRWPTVFNLLETHNPNIDTITIANWNVIADIAGAGSIPADQIYFVPQVPGDTNWLLTDDAVGAATVAAIQNAQPGTPTFMFTYFVGVDENGHMYGGASPQYAEAIRNVDENLGAIMAEIAEREKCNPGLCENWTVIVVTDHGHQPQKGFGHGFQTPSETSTFVIARGSDFADGYINLQYQIVDTTPTVLTLFGATPPGHVDGVSLTTLGDSDVDPVDLHQALFDAIAMNGYPDIGTNVALSLRTIFTSIPYFVYTFTYDVIDQLKSIAGQDIFLVSALAGLAVVPVQLVGNLLYVATNIPAQIVARLTGVTGASIFPLIPPPPSTWPPSQLNVPDLALLACGEDASGAASGAPCNAAIVA